MHKASKDTDKRLNFIAIIIGVFVSVLVLSTFVFPGITRYPYYYIKCGHAPIVTTGIAGSKAYYTTDKDSILDAIFYDKFFCTEEEAKQLQYHK